MIDAQRIEVALAAIATAIKEGRAISGDVGRDRNSTRAFERIKRWRERTTRSLTEHVHPSEGASFGRRSKGSFRVGDPVGNVVDEVEYFVAFLESLAEEVQRNPAAILDAPIPSQGTDSEGQGDGLPAMPIGNSVFVVHGHDELNMRRLKDLIRDRWKLDPIVMMPLAGRGRTLIEKFEQEAQPAAFAFVLMTPDDTVVGAAAAIASSQARPNVIFELGWFYGRLGRAKVCIVFKKGTSIHSDLDGIERVEFEHSVEEVATKLEQELLAAKLLKPPSN